MKRGYRLHRLAWFYVFNEWPAEIDHINHIINDNRIDNLRNVAKPTNSKNRGIQKNNSSGFNGVMFHKDSKKWIAYVGIDKKTITLGYFDDIESAIKRRNEANIKYNFHSNHGL